MYDARQYRFYAVDCLLKAKACQSDYRSILVSIAATCHALARQDEAIDMLLNSWSVPQRPSAQILTRAEPWNISMTVPYYVGEDKSEMRGIKPGWYAMEVDGSLVAGPFDTSEKCVDRNLRPANGRRATELLYRPGYKIRKPAGARAVAAGRTAFPDFTE